MDTFSKGSEWRKWDLHIHSPASNGYLGNYDDLMKTLTSSEAEVFGINDYCTVEGYEEILSKGGIKNKVLFPVIELRMNNIIANRKGTPTQGGVRINFHLIFNNEPNVLKRAKTWLTSLDCYNEHGKSDQLGNISKANIEKITFDFEKVIKSLENVDLRKEVLIWLPYDEYGGIDDIDPHDNFFKLGLIKNADIIGSSTKKQIDFFLWRDDKFSQKKYKEWFEKPLPCMKGSDSHEAKYPAGMLRDANSEPIQRYCWIKAEPTFEGLKQITIEPTDRIYIGLLPQKLVDVENNKSRYISSINISHLTQGHVPSWFENNIPLNSGLVAIIGKKGSGKSAIADIIALNGKSSIPPNEYSFLTKEKFRKKDLAKNYSSSMIWIDGTREAINLNNEVDISTEVEKVKYLPQRFVETICNENGVSELFQQEINKVIFSYVDPTERLDTNNLDELIELKTSVVDQLVTQHRDQLRQTNLEIVELENKTSETYKTKLVNELAEKERKLKGIVTPKEVTKPTGKLNPATQQKVNDLSDNIERLKKEIKVETTNLTNTNNKLANLNKIRESLQLLETKVQEYLQKLEDSAKDISLDLGKIFDLKINFDLISKKEEEFSIAKTEIEKKLAQNNSTSKVSLYTLKDKLQKELDSITENLNKEQKNYQDYLKALQEFKEKQAKIVGEKGDIGLTTITSIKTELTYVEKGLLDDLKKRYENRINLAKKIFNQLLVKIKFYKEIYQPLINFIEEERELQEKSGNILNFSVGLNFNGSEFSEEFFSFINQNRDGSFQGKESGEKLLKSILDKLNIDTVDGVLDLPQEIIEHLKKDMTTSTNESKIIDSQLKRDKKELYNFLYGLEYLNVQYKIIFNGKDLNENEFSPGEKGALLLIFYLHIDKNKIPLIMDQPEENLDNESVYTLLVPYIKKAKQGRQIFVVTHNPNLAIVCDSEQIICASMDKKKNEIRYVTGSIENPAMNEKITDILEGTLPAFDNRDKKYIRN